MRRNHPLSSKQISNEQIDFWNEFNISAQQSADMNDSYIVRRWSRYKISQKKPILMTNRIWTTLSWKVWIPISDTAFGNIGLSDHEQTWLSLILRHNWFLRSKKGANNLANTSSHAAFKTVPKAYWEKARCSCNCDRIIKIASKLTPTLLEISSVFAIVTLAASHTRLETLILTSTL